LNAYFLVFCEEYFFTVVASITPPINVANIFENWLNEIDKKTKAHIWIGTCAVGNYRNDVNLNKSETANFLQAIRKGTH
jgi:Iap family predicted aminopeptidase